MTRAPQTALALSALFSLFGCGLEEPAPPAPPKGVSGGTETTGAGDEASVNPPERPCGDATLAVVKTGPGASVSFCSESGAILIGETAPLGVGSAIRAAGIDDVAATCAADLFRALAPGEPVPQALLYEDCSDRAPKSGDRGPAGPPASTPEAASYCGSGGATNFRNEQCSKAVCWAGWDCSMWCTVDLWGWHDRALSWQMGGEEGDYGEDRVASCNGTTRFRAYWREGTGDAWINTLDYTIASGGWAWWYYHPVDIWADQDFRFRADSSSGASHRHAGWFGDW